MYDVCVPSMNNNLECFRNEAFFSPFYQMVTMEMMTIRKISTSVLAVYFQVLGLYKVSLP